MCARCIARRGYRAVSVIFRGCVQPAQQRAQTKSQVPITTATRHKAEVVKQDNQGPEAKQNEHQYGHPGGAVLCVHGYRRGVTAARAHRGFVMTQVMFGLMATLRGYASARFLLCCHVTSVEHASTRQA